jgi:hypothetical protein
MARRPAPVDAAGQSCVNRCRPPRHSQIPSRPFLRPLPTRRQLTLLPRLGFVACPCSGYASERLPAAAESFVAEIAILR